MNPKRILLLGEEKRLQGIQRSISKLYKEYSFKYLKQPTFKSVTQKYSPTQVAGLINRGEEYIELHSRLVDHYQLPGPSHTAVKHFRDKALMHRLMVEHDLAKYRPQTQACALEELPEKLKNSNFPVVIKPYQGAKSRGVFVLQSLRDYTPEIKEILKNHFSHEASLKNKSAQKILIEEFIVGKQVTSTAYLDHFGKLHSIHLANVFDGRDFGANHQQLITRTTPARTSRKIKKEIEDILQKLADISGLKSTFLHPDFIVTLDKKVKLIELNVRLGGLRLELNKYAFGLDLDKISLKLALGETPNPKPLFEKSCTGVDLWSEQSGKVQKLILPQSKYIVQQSSNFQPGDQYLAPPEGNKHLARFFVQTNKNSFSMAKKLIQRAKIEIKA